MGGKDKILCPDCGFYGGVNYDVTPDLTYICDVCGHKWKGRKRMSKPRIVIRLDGGLIQEIFSDQPVEIIQLDTDLDGTEEQELILYPDEEGNENSATAWYCDTDKEGDPHGETCPSLVNRIFKRVKSQLKDS